MSSFVASVSISLLYRLNEKTFLFDIVANRRNGLDVDRCVLHTLLKPTIISENPELITFTVTLS